MDCGPVDVTITLEKPHHWKRKLVVTPLQQLYVSPWQTTLGNPLLVISKVSGTGHFLLCCADETEFVITASGNHVWLAKSSNTHADQVQFNLIYTVLIFVLGLRGISCLHAAAIEAHGFGFALLGAERTGKSLVTASLAAQGYPVLTDDVLTLTEDGGRFLANSGYPWLCLRPDSIPLLSKDKDASNLVLSAPWVYQDETFVTLELDQNGYTFRPCPVALARIYILQGLEDHTGAEIDSVAGGERLTALLPRAQGSRLWDRSAHTREFHRLGRLAASVPLRHVRFSADAGGLQQACVLLAQDFQATTR